ncbi:haloacid dehalogenase [Paenibacillus mucilaginosus K02]|uniref:Haloacid dehalogenase n=1 Tax=Paenibacillus mucilaginosus K02 TaxID=997761 RepID=I0BFY0_9BACL|nr:haloacid dehalogenase [Paenibacillus mucilaginosus K02]
MIVAIRAITLDLWDTLYHDCPVRDGIRRRRREELIHQRLYELGYAVERARLNAAIRRAADTSRKQWDEEYYTPGAQERLLFTLAHMQIALSPNELIRLSEEVAEIGCSYPPLPFEETKKTIAELACVFPLAIISDTGQTSGDALRRVLQRDGLLDYFKVLTFSDETGASKPHARAFVLTLEKLGVSPGEAVHIGDHETKDCLGALNAGMRTIHLAPRPSPSLEPNSGYYHLEGIGQVPGLLSSLSVEAGR